MVRRRRQSTTITNWNQQQQQEQQEERLTLTTATHFPRKRSFASRRASLQSRQSRRSLYALAQQQQQQQKKNGTEGDNDYNEEEEHEMIGFLHRKRRELQLQIASLEAQLEFTDVLEHMKDEAKMKLLFNVVDRDRDGKVSARELGRALRKRGGHYFHSSSSSSPHSSKVHDNITTTTKNETDASSKGDDDACQRNHSSSLSAQASLHHAIETVAIYDTDGDARLSLNEFADYIRVLLTEMGEKVTFDEYANYMVLQSLFAEDDDNDDDDNDNNEEHNTKKDKRMNDKRFNPSNPNGVPSSTDKQQERQQSDLDDDIDSLEGERDDVDEQVKSRGQLLALLGDERLLELFELLDKDNRQELSFNNVAIVLYQLTKTMEPSVSKSCLELLLTLDHSDKDDNHDETHVLRTSNNKSAATRRRSSASFIYNNNQKMDTTTLEKEEKENQRHGDDGNVTKEKEEELKSQRFRHERTITYEQFGRLMLGFVALRGTSFDEIADELVLALLTTTKDDIPEQDWQALLVPCREESMATLSGGNDGAPPPSAFRRRSSVRKSFLSQSMRSLRSLSTKSFVLMTDEEEEVDESHFDDDDDEYIEEVIEEEYEDYELDDDEDEELNSIVVGKLEKLFDLWDNEQTGSVSRRDLELGFQMFENSTGGADDSNRQSPKKTSSNEKLRLIFSTVLSSVSNNGEEEHETDQLDIDAFVSAIALYAELSNNIDLHELIDFLCLTIALPESKAILYTQAYEESHNNETKNNQCTPITTTASSAVATNDITEKLRKPSTRNREHRFRRPIRLQYINDESTTTEDALNVSLSSISTKHEETTCSSTRVEEDGPIREETAEEETLHEIKEKNEPYSFNTASWRKGEESAPVDIQVPNATALVNEQGEEGNEKAAEGDVAVIKHEETTYTSTQVEEDGPIREETAMEETLHDEVEENNEPDPLTSASGRKGEEPVQVDIQVPNANEQGEEGDEKAAEGDVAVMERSVKNEPALMESAKDNDDATSADEAAGDMKEEAAVTGLEAVTKDHEAAVEERCDDMNDGHAIVEDDDEDEESAVYLGIISEIDIMDPTESATEQSVEIPEVGDEHKGIERGREAKYQAESIVEEQETSDGGAESPFQEITVSAVPVEGGEETQKPQEKNKGKDPNSAEQADQDTIIEDEAVTKNTRAGNDTTRPEEHSTAAVMVMEPPDDGPSLAGQSGNLAELIERGRNSSLDDSDEFYSADDVMEEYFDCGRLIL